MTKAGLTRSDLQASLEKLPQQIQDLVDRTAYQVQQLRTAVKTFYEARSARMTSHRCRS